jgi:hypothetical protein
MSDIDRSPEEHPAQNRAGRNVRKEATLLAVVMLGWLVTFGIYYAIDRDAIAAIVVALAVSLTIYLRARRRIV